MNNKNIPFPKKSIELAELIGIILGDGHLHKKNNLITITESFEDLDYYKNRVIKIFENLFNKAPVLRKRKDRNAYYLMIYSKEIMNILVNDIGLIRGSKINAKIPPFIFSNKERALAFLCGMFDTNGCLKFSKQNKNINYYPRVQIALRDSPLSDQLEEVIKCVGFKYGKWKETRFNGIVFYQISGKINLERWFKEVKPQNAVHKSKFEFWKRFGYYIPKSTLKYRKKKLSAC